MRRGNSDTDTFISSHVEEISKNPRIDIGKVRDVRYLHEFDRLAFNSGSPYPGTKCAYSA
jgi:hypothetical protein